MRANRRNTHYFDTSFQPSERREERRNVSANAAPNRFERTPNANIYTGATKPAHNPQTLSGLRDGALQEALKRLGADHVHLDYTTARHQMFTRVDNHGGTVRDVYTRRLIETNVIPDADHGPRMNTEHTWPRSHGVKGTVAESDLHHLFPADSHANSQRANLPFGEVTRVTWQQNGSKLGYDRNGRTVFEPPPEHRGNVARALFYVATRYNMHIDNQEEAVLRSWNEADGVDAAEVQRNDAVSQVQHDRNPFVDEPGLAARIEDF